MSLIQALVSGRSIPWTVPTPGLPHPVTAHAGRGAPALAGAAGLLLLTVCAVASAQSSPFMTGATALQSNILAWLTPIAVIAVMVLGAMAMANRMSWGWCIAAILGIAIAFGAPQIVSWVRGMFGV
jgi:type IV secretion system protein VirB2